MFLPLTDFTAPIELIALDAARNIRRRYAITMDVDLFGMIIVETRWGRIGTKGQRKCLAFPDREAGERHVSNILRRRGTAEHRIGVAYRPVVSIHQARVDTKRL